MKRIFTLCLTLTLLLVFSACSAFKSNESEQVPNKSSKNSEVVSEKLEKKAFEFNPYYLPEYGKEFVGDNLFDYNAIISALLKGQPQVFLTTIDNQAEFVQLRRAITIFYIAKNLLYDYRYTMGNGPFSFNESTKTLTITYAYSKEECIKKNDEFKKLIEQIFKDNVTDIDNKLETSKELYLYVVKNTEYKLDMTLETYDAFVLHKAFCQTYSKMYQYLLWQVDIKNYLSSSSDGDHEWNMVCLDGKFYNMDTTWDSGNLSYFGMDDTRCAQTGHGTNYLRPSDALLDNYAVKVPECTSDIYNKYWESLTK